MAIAHVVTKGYGNYGATSVTPCTLSVSDNADGTGGVATISGSQGGTVTVYSLSQFGTTWTSRGTRTGDGTVTLALADGWYWWYAEESSIKSNLVFEPFTGETRIAAIETAFIQLLRSNSDVTDLVGENIHAGHRKQGDTLPAICIRKIESGDDHTLTHDETWRQPKVLVEVFAADYFAASELAELVRELEDTSGTVTCYKADGTTYRSIYIELIEIEDEDLDSPAPVDGSDNWTERHAILFNVICQRPS